MSTNERKLSNEKRARLDVALAELGQLREEYVLLEDEEAKGENLDRRYEIVKRVNRYLNAGEISTTVINNDLNTD